MVRSVSVKVVANIREYKASMQQMARETKQFRDELSETAAKGQGDLDAVANGAIAAGAALTAAFVGVVNKGADFEHAMAQVNAVSGATAEEFEAMRQSAIDMGSSTSFSATEAAAATEELAKAGLSAADITGGALAGSLNLAAAGGIGLAEAAGLAATSMSQFELEANDVNDVADTLAGAANSSNTTVSELGQALKNVGTVASQSGLEMEDTVGMLSALADNALNGAEAGTALRTTLLRLLAPTGEAKAEMERLGIEVFNANGEAKSATEIVAELERGLGTLSMEQRSAAMSVLFGQEAMAGANVLLKEGSDGIGEYIDQVSEQGAAAETAGDRLDSLQGDIQLLNSALESLAIEASGGATEGLRVLVQAATEFIGALDDIPTPVSATVTVLGGLLGAGLLVQGMALKVRDRMAQVNTTLAATGVAGGKAATALRTVGTAAGGVIGVIGTLQAASSLLSATLDEELNPQVDALGVGLRRWAQNGDVSGEAARVLGEDFDRFREAIEATANEEASWIAQQSSVPFFNPVGDRLEENTERVQAMDQALAQMQQSDPEGAAMVFERISEEADNLGLSTERLKELFPEYFAALETTTEKTQEATEQTKPYKAELDLLADAFGLTGESSEEAVTQMLDAWAEGAARFIDLVGAYEEGMAELEEDQELTTQGFIENLREQAEAQEEWAENLRELAERGVGDMVNELAAMGPEGADMVALMADMTDEELQEVVELWGLRGQEAADEIAGSILEGTDNSIDGLNNLQGVIDSLHGTDITITTTQVNELITRNLGPNANTIVERWGGITHHAQAGLLRQADVFGPVSPARFAFAEPATGGEAFIPRRGDRARSLSILSEAAGWYGADVVPDGRHQWRGTQPITITGPDAEDGPRPAGGRQFGRVFVERQEVSVHSHSDTFSYQQTMDEIAWHGAS